MRRVGILFLRSHGTKKDTIPQYLLQKLSLYDDLHVSPVPMFNVANVAGAGIIAYGAVLSMLVLHTLALLFIPSMLYPGAKPWAVGKAAYCYVLQFVGVFLMSIGGIPAVYGVVQKLIIPQVSFTTQTYLALLLVFAVGGLTFLWHEHMALTIDDASRKVCASIFLFTIKLIGYFLMMFSALSILLTMLFAGKTLGVVLPVMPLILFFYGLLLSWSTRSPWTGPKTFHSSPMVGSMHAAMRPGAKKKK